MSLLRVASVAAALWALEGGASGAPGKAKPSPAPAVLVGAGDIATCESIAGAEATAKLLDTNSEARATGVLGVLELTLRPRSYEWRFIGVAGQAFTDSGTEACH